jgi:hypothetical protein
LSVLWLALPLGVLFYGVFESKRISMLLYTLKLHNIFDFRETNDIWG